MKYNYLVVGAGLFGAVFAHEAKKKGKKCLVIEKRDHIGGNVYTQEVEGIHVHKYGSHIFHTSNKQVWDYVNQFAEFNNYVNAPLAIYKDELYNLPFNMNTFSKMWGIKTPREAKDIIASQIAEYQVNRGKAGLKQAGFWDAESEQVSHGKAGLKQASFWDAESEQVSHGKAGSERAMEYGAGESRNLEEQALSLAGPDIYEKLIKGYTEKQWGRPCTELPAFIIKRLPFRFTYDNNYFNDRYQGIPIGGYTKMVEKMLQGVEVRTETDYFKFVKEHPNIAQKTVFTGMIDEYFNYQLGALEYRSVRFETEVPDTDNYQGNAVVNYTEKEVPYTRIIEHKHFEFGTQEKTVISKEYSLEWAVGMEPYYPVNNEQNNTLYEKYKELAAREADVIFGGRLGNYKYYDMDKVIEAALQICETELG